MPVCKTARFRVKGESQSLCEAAVRAFVEAVRTHEPRTRLYVSLQDPLEPTRFQHVMVFEDAAAEAAHREAPWTRQFVAALYPRLQSQGVEFEDWSLFAGRLGA